jgi:hypothetical protein
VTVEKLRELYNTRPFQRFVIHIADGREIPVPHPEWMLFVPGTRLVHVAQRDSTVNIIDVMLVTDVELKPNGKAKGRKQRTAGR